MDRIICDICGTTYHASAQQCPICGAKQPNPGKSVPVQWAQEPPVESHRKGGRFAMTKEQKKYQETTAPVYRKEQPPVQTWEQPQPRRGNPLLIALLVTVTFVLLVGTAVILLLEWSNPETFGPMPVWQKVMNAFFQTGTLRTAGFVTVDQAALRDATKAFSILVMFIGGSSGSTAGGLKTVTVLVLLLFIWAKARGKHSVHVFKRNIPQEKAMDAMTITFITVLLSIFGAMLICAASQVSFLDAWYEAVSAICTVGLTAAGTADLGILAQSIIIAFMYFGRVGILTLSLGFLMGDKAKDRFQYADTNLLIG